MTYEELEATILRVLEDNCYNRCMDDDKDRVATATLLAIAIKQHMMFKDQNYQS